MADRVRSYGGRIAVQDPNEALAADMPQCVVDVAGADFVAPVDDIAAWLAPRVTTHADGSERKGPMPRDEETIPSEIQSDIREQETGDRTGELSIFSCPDCGGVLWQMDQERLVHFRCHIGHRYAPDSLLVQKTEQLEAALVSALRLLKEKAILLRQTAERARRRGERDSAARLTEQAEVDMAHAALLQRELLEAEPASISTIQDEVGVSRQPR